MENKKKGKYIERIKMYFMKQTPSQTVIISFLMFVGLGTVLLMLPISNAKGEWTGIYDALFTAVSAVCVTGLVVVNTFEYWSLFGKIVLLILIQVGGLGFMTILTFIYISIGRKITLKERLIIQSTFNKSTIDGMIRLTLRAIRGTLLIELVAGIMLSIFFYYDRDINVMTSIWYGTFHAVSAFCNAGFDILGDNSLMRYDTNLFTNIVFSTLIVLGGLGFVVWDDFIVKVLKNKKKITMKKKYSSLTLHSKIVISTTFYLILSGVLFTFALEFNNSETIGNYSLYGKAITSFFQSITLRTAGFNTINLSALNDGTKFIYIIYMLIGGSPGGTAGGLKTVTFAVIVISVLSSNLGKEKAECFKREIPLSVLQKSLSILGMYTFTLVAGTVLLSVTEVETLNSFNFIDLLFETASALGTVGVTVGITSELTNIGKIIVSIIMFLGRLGPITIGVALTIKQSTKVNKLDFPEEEVLVG